MLFFQFLYLNQFIAGWFDAITAGLESACGEEVVEFVVFDEGEKPERPGRLKTSKGKARILLLSQSLLVFAPPQIRTSGIPAYGSSRVITSQSVIASRKGSKVRCFTIKSYEQFSADLMGSAAAI